MKKFIELPSVKTNRLVLEPLQQHHSKDLYDAFCEPELYQFINLESPQSLDHFAKGVRRVCQGYSADGRQIWLNWISKSRSSGEMAGKYEATLEKEVAFLGYTTFKPYQRQGYGKEALIAIMGQICANYDIEKFVIEMDTRNLPSIKMAEALGFDWVATTNNVQDIRGFQSHEFRFEKMV